MMIYIIHAYECLRGISEIIMKPVKSTKAPDIRNVLSSETSH